MAPMVDMVFLLLVFFMCVTALSGARTRHQVDLPQTKAPTAAHQESAYVVLSLDSNGGLSIDGVIYDRAALPAKLRELKAATAGTLQARIRADALTPYRDIEALLADCARAGITRIAYAARPDQVTSVRMPGGGRQ